MDKVISGGQTGSDQAGLRAAKDSGILTGGWIPKGFLTENGANKELATLFRIQEHPSGNYPPRTYANVRDSDGTIRIAYDFSTPGEKCTLKAIHQYKKPYFDVDANNSPPCSDALQWIRNNNIKILNVAGNRESTHPGIGEFAYDYLIFLFEKEKMNNSQKIQLERIKIGSFNSFDGEKVAKGLELHRNLWHAFVFGRFRYGVLIELRDLALDCINADTIMLISSLDKVEELAKLAREEWDADEVGWNWIDENFEFMAKGSCPHRNKEEMFNDLGGSLDDNQVVVRLWWD